MNISSIRKSLAAALGALLTVLTFTGNFSAFLPASWTTTIGVIISILTPIVTWLVPNKAKTPAQS